MTRSALLNVMTQAATKAGRGLIRDFGEVEQLQVSVKGPGDFVSAADHKAEETIRRELERARPGYGFLLEESGVIEGSDKTHRFIVDPLDGTTNFLHGMPLFAISIALERENELVAGVIHNPILNETYVAERGKGAFVNDRRLRVAKRRKLSDCILTCGIPHHGRGNPRTFFADMARVIPEVAGIRRTGSAALDLAWVAAGRFDGFWERGLSPWDTAAGIVLVREAGGMVSDLEGGSRMFSRGDILAANPEIHNELVRTIPGLSAVA